MDFGIDFALGALLAAGFVWLARRAGRAELPWIAAGLVVAAVAYPLMGIGAHGLGGMPVEGVGAALFCVLALMGATLSAWWLALGWGLHAFFDLLLPWVADTAYVPPWYAALCVGFDLVVAGAMVARAARGPAGSGARGPAPETA